jgi:predicted amidophosphoribosyltransferase
MDQMVEAVRTCPNCGGKLTLFSTDPLRVRYYCRECKRFLSILRRVIQSVAFVKKGKTTVAKPSVARPKGKKRKERKMAVKERKTFCAGCKKGILPSDKYCPFCGKKQD